MARSKRQYGSGCLLKRGRGWAIRRRETEIAPDGTTRRVLRYETLGQVSRRHAGDLLAQRLVAAGNSKAPVRSRVAFRTFASEWQAHVLPMYKHSTQKNHRHILEKHLLPRFGDKPIVEVTRQEIQAFVAQLNQAGYAPKTIDHIHDVLSALLRTAVKWGHLHDNPARGVDLPRFKPFGRNGCSRVSRRHSCSTCCRCWDARWQGSRCCLGFGAASCSRCGGRISKQESVPHRASGGI